MEGFPQNWLRWYELLHLKLFVVIWTVYSELIEVARAAFNNIAETILGGPSLKRLEKQIDWKHMFDTPTVYLDWVS